MKTAKLEIDKLTTERLILIPFTIEICRNVLANDYSDLDILNIKKGKSWPDVDVMDTLPRIINNLEKSNGPTGFESWMIIKKDTLEIIGDLGFKGFNYEEESIDLGYGIIKEERRNGYATEAIRELIKWAFSTKVVRTITANCLTENMNSMHLLSKFKFTLKSIEHNKAYWHLHHDHYEKMLKVTNIDHAV